MALLTLLFFASSAFATNLELELNGLRSGKGGVAVALFSQEKGFPDKAEPEKEFYFPLEGKQEDVLITIAGLKPGTYAAALFHDENGNHSLEKDIFGIPTEGFGFSGNPKIYFGAPSFSRSKIEVIGDTFKTKVKMKHF